MALANYSDLKSAAADWIERSDLTTIIPDAVTLAEAKFNRLLRVGQMEDSETLTALDGVASLPSDFLAVRRVRISGKAPMDLVTPEWASAAYPAETSSDAPGFYAIQGTSLVTYPPYTGDIELDYYGKIPALSEASPTNWLLTSNPDLYLWQTLAELNVYMMHAEKAAMFDSRALGLINDLNIRDQWRRSSGGAIRVMGPVV